MLRAGLALDEAVTLPQKNYYVTMYSWEVWLTAAVDGVVRAVVAMRSES